MSRPTAPSHPSNHLHQPTQSPPRATPRHHYRTRVLILTHDHHITVINAATGEVLRDFTLDPTRDYQPTGAPKGPQTGTVDLTVFSA
ncbi:MAG: hypothetical protein P4L86_11080 [Mycobacterium sp.]|nr:hypothetical protein [Mycobacterium sp.]